MSKNKVEKIVQALKPNTAIHLGHSSVVGNFGGLRVGLDLTSIDGTVPAPFSNLTLTSNKTQTFLIPLLDPQSMIARPSKIANHVDLLLYSHLHSDHFSLRYIEEAKRTNPKLRIICPPKTKDYLSRIPMRYKNGIRGKIGRWLTKKTYKLNAVGVIDFIKELRTNSENRKNLIESIEEIELSESITFVIDNYEIKISAFPVVHPTAQLYIKQSFEGEPPPPMGYKIEYREGDVWRTAILVGEAATDPKISEIIFAERNRLSVVFFPVTEQSETKGWKFVEEFTTHASLRNFALIERIVKKGTKIIPLHQGLWYFQATSQDFVDGRSALLKLAQNPSSKLPFLELSKRFNKIIVEKKWHFWKRWRWFRKLAEIATLLPINGEIVGIPPSTVVEFGNEKRVKQNNELSIHIIQAALQAHLTEFECLRDEINNAWDFQKALLQYTLLVIGSTVTLVNALPDFQLVLLLASYALTAMGWVYIEQSFRMITIGRYYKSSLNPRVNSLIKELGNRDDHEPIMEKVKVLGWEDFFRAGNVRTLLMGWSSLGKYSFAILPGPGFAFAFYNIKQSPITLWSTMEIVGFLVAVGMSLLPLATIIINARFSFTAEGAA